MRGNHESMSLRGSRVAVFSSCSWEMRSIVARGAIFGMAVSYMISAEQRAGYILIGYLLEHTLFFTFYITELVVRLGTPLDRC